MPEHELDRRLDELTRALPARRPPRDFADRVMAARGRARPHQRGRPSLALAAALICGVALGWLLARSPTPTPRAGSGVVIEATTRQSVTLGDRGVAVLEPGAALTWRVTADGAAHLEQRKGRVFYRATRGGPFVVETPVGEARALGTCFSVEVEMPSSSFIKGGALGAVAAAALVVGVYEGRVAVHNSHGHAIAAPGDTIRAAAGEAPSLEAPVARVAPLPPLEPKPPAPAPQTSPAVAALERELAAAREELAIAREALEAEEAQREEEEGTPIPFPKDLAPQFEREALVENYTSAFAELEIDGEIERVDCSEFPCLVIGTMVGVDSDVMRRLGQTEAMLVYAQDAQSNGMWGSREEVGGEEVVRYTFVSGITGKEEREAGGENLSKRIRLRSQEAVDALKREAADEE